MRPLSPEEYEVLADVAFIRPNDPRLEMLRRVAEDLAARGLMSHRSGGKSESFITNPDGHLAVRVHRAFLASIS